jgi:hypothetical protein
MPLLRSALASLLPVLRAWTDAVRRNHGLEHATVTILLARHGPQRLAGRASAHGFFILGKVDERELQSCAEEALRRLQRGEGSLAVSPLCGTNIAVTSLLAAGAATAVLSTGRARERFGNAFTATMLAVIAGQPLGRMIQKYLTTRADLDGIELVETRTLLPGLRKVYTRPIR